MARAETELPQQSVVVPGFSEQVARERLMESDLQPLEGICYYPNEDMTLAIERWQPEPSHKIGYRLLLVASDDLELLPGTVIGYIEASAVDNKYRLWLYSERNKVTLCGPLECVATLNKEATTLTFDPPHWEVKVRALQGHLGDSRCGERETSRGLQKNLPCRRQRQQVQQSEIPVISVKCKMLSVKWGQGVPCQPKC